MDYGEANAKERGGGGGGGGTFKGDTLLSSDGLKMKSMNEEFPILYVMSAFDQKYLLLNIILTISIRVYF